MTRLARLPLPGLLVVCLFAACGSKPDRAGKAATPPGLEPGPWAPLPPGPPAETAAQPTTYKAGKGPHLVLFTASWCGPCTAGVLVDRALISEIKGKIAVGVAISEPDHDFMISQLAHWFHDLPVWNEQSSRDLAASCKIESLPGACLLDGDKLLWRGETGNAGRAIHAFLAGRLEQDNIDALTALDELKRYIAGKATDAQIAAILPRLVGLDGAVSDLVWDMVKGTISPAACKLALPLARQTVDDGHGLSFATLCGLALAESKCGDKARAKKVAQRAIDACAAVKGHCELETNVLKTVLEPNAAPPTPPTPPAPPAPPPATPAPSLPAAP
jgi:hypothetical protein